MPDAFTIETEQSDSTGTVRVSGDFDLAAARRVESALRTLEEAKLGVIVLDLRGVEFLDSTGLRTITSADARARDDGRVLKIVRGSEQVQKLLHVTGMDKILPLVDDPADTPERI